MADIVERLRLFVPHCEDPNDYLEDELLFLEAADEIERLRKALSFFFEMNDNGVGLKYTHIEAQRLAVTELTREKE